MAAEADGSYRWTHKLRRGTDLSCNRRTLAKEGCRTTRKQQAVAAERHRTARTQAKAGTSRRTGEQDCRKGPAWAVHSWGSGAAAAAQVTVAQSWVARG